MSAISTSKPLGLRRTQCIEDHRAGIGARSLLHDCGAAALGPDVQLLGGGGAEGIAGGQHHLAAGLRQPQRQLADGGGLARSVHAHDHDHVGLARCASMVSGTRAGRDDGQQFGAQGGQQGIGIGQFAARHAARAVFPGSPAWRPRPRRRRSAALPDRPAVPRRSCRPRNRLVKSPARRAALRESCSRMRPKNPVPAAAADHALS